MAGGAVVMAVAAKVAVETEEVAMVAAPAAAALVAAMAGMAALAASMAMAAAVAVGTNAHCADHKEARRHAAGLSLLCLARVQGRRQKLDCPMRRACHWPTRRQKRSHWRRLRRTALRSSVHLRRPSTRFPMTKHGHRNGERRRRWVLRTQRQSRSRLACPSHRKWDCPTCE